MIDRDAIKAFTIHIKNEAGSHRLEDILGMLQIRVKDKPANSPLLHGGMACLSFRNNAYQILISNRCPIEARAFVIAHEIGHAILHRDVFAPRFGIYRQASRIEDEADYFALQLLGIAFDFSYYQDYCLEQIAFEAGISERAAELLYEDWISEVKKRFF